MKKSAYTTPHLSVHALRTNRLMLVSDTKRMDMQDKSQGVEDEQYLL